MSLPNPTITTTVPTSTSTPSPMSPASISASNPLFTFLGTLFSWLGYLLAWIIGGLVVPLYIGALGYRVRCSTMGRKFQKQDDECAAAAIGTMVLQLSFWGYLGYIYDVEAPGLFMDMSLLGLSMVGTLISRGLVIAVLKVVMVGRDVYGAVRAKERRDGEEEQLKAEDSAAGYVV